jgi:hypothetical protein
MSYMRPTRSRRIHWQPQRSKSAYCNHKSSKNGRMVHRKQWLVLFVVLLAGAVLTNSIAATITVGSVADADIRQLDPITHHGDEPSVTSGQ